MRSAGIRALAYFILTIALGCTPAEKVGGGVEGAGHGAGGGTREIGSAAALESRVDSIRLLLPLSERGPELSGTLTFPSSGCPCPTAILLQGAGSHDRDYTIFDHKPFSLLARYLAENGVATLRFDERGIGDSGGRPGVATPDEMAGDVLGWMELLHTLAPVDPDRIGVLGHSEGGIVGALVGARDSGLAFLILMGTPGLPGPEYNLQYEASVGRSMGLDDSSIQSNTRFQARVLDVLLEEGDGARKERELRELYRELTPQIPPDRIERTISHLLSPRFLFNLRYDPSQTLSAVSAPVLALFGEKDAQVPPERNVEAMRSALDIGSGRDRVIVLQDLNHFMQPAPTGSPEEYPHIQETLSPEAMELVLRWIRNHSGPRDVGSCTVMLASDGESVLGAANEDWEDPLTRFWIIPGKDGKHGWIKFGFAGGFPQAGMNDQGLFWDATGSPYLEMPRSEATKTFFDGPLMVKVMEEAGTVPEARGIFDAHYCEDQYRAQYLVGDAQGASMIVEGDSILLKEGRYQVLTNFYQSRPDLGGHPCGRFEAASRILGGAETVTPFLMGQALDATHQSGKYPTQYSVIYDLPAQRIYLFHFHDFYEYLTLDLAEEISKGPRFYDIPSLFSRIRLLSPEFQSSLSGETVELRWEGRLDSQYRLCFSTSPDPGGACSVIQPMVISESGRGNLLLGTVSFLFLVAVAPARIRNRRAGLVFLLLAAPVATACGSDFVGPDDEAEPGVVGEMAYTVGGLQAGNTYYWKLKATAPGVKDFATETVTFSFTTTE